MIIKLIIKLITHKIDITYTTMTQLLSLGAINKVTGEYVYPKIANKKDEYICPECNKDLILVKGEIRVHHFRHKVDGIDPCQHYCKPTESQIHKDAKMLLKTLLENKTNIQFVRQCVSCKITNEINLPEITECSIITLEHRFNYEDELRIADVAHTLNGEIKGIYEICYTHKTCSENRPEPWVEIDANSLLTLVNTNNELIINCIRCEKCEDCLICGKCIKYEVCLMGGSCGSKDRSWCKGCIIEFIEIIKDRYKFITEQVSIFAPNFPDTTKIIACDADYDNYIIVDCVNNFSKDEKDVIDKFNINNIEDLIRNDKISKNDKQRCLKCFAYVREIYELTWIEPFNGHNVIQLEKLAISIRILPTGIIKYCKSLGEQNVKDFTMIGMV